MQTKSRVMVGLVIKDGGQLKVFVQSNRDKKYAATQMSCNCTDVQERAVIDHEAEGKESLPQEGLACGKQPGSFPRSADTLPSSALAEKDTDSLTAKDTSCMFATSKRMLTVFHRTPDGDKEINTTATLTSVFRI